MVDIDLLNQVSEQGWEIEFNQSSYERFHSAIKRYSKQNQDQQVEPVD